jgi:hypothetical protein
MLRQSLIFLVLATCLQGATSGYFAPFGRIDDHSRAQLRALAAGKTNQSTEWTYWVGNGSINTSCWLASVDLSGISTVESDSRCVALLSLNKGISTAHSPPGVGSTLVFRATNGALHTNAVASQSFIGTNDVMIVTLQSNVVAGINPLSVLDDSLMNRLFPFVCNGDTECFYYDLFYEEFLALNGTLQTVIIYRNNSRAYQSMLRQIVFTAPGNPPGSLFLAQGDQRPNDASPFWLDLNTATGGASSSPVLAVVKGRAALIGMLHTAQWRMAWAGFPSTFDWIKSEIPEASSVNLTGFVLRP